MDTITLIPKEHPLELLRRCGGYYERPPGGPLVGYAGRYGDTGKQYVGTVYVNFAKAERRSIVLYCMARSLIEKFPEFAVRGDGFCAAPEGGKALAVALAALTARCYIFPEKETLEPKTVFSREKSRLVWGRHEPERGEEWWIVEDVCNNFSTTEQMIELIEGRGATVLGIICFLNRSPEVSGVFTSSHGRGYPVCALVERPIAEYEQDDPMVAADITSGNIVWKPKNEWPRLEAAMKAAK